MRVLILFSAIFLTVCGLSELEQWQSFKLNHKKTYYNNVEEKLRFQIFNNNLKKIEEHNVKYENGEVGYYMGINQFTDMTDKEFSDMLQLQVSTKPEITGTVQKFPKDLKVPDSINWLEKGAVLPVRDQGDCGACWAFGTTGALEGQNAIINNVSVVLSTQQLMDCSQRYGNHGCNGGLQTFAFDYVADYGIQSESSYPYTTEVTECKYSVDDVVMKIDHYKRIEKTEEALKAAIGTIGPVTVSIDASYLKSYKGGIFDDFKNCPNYADRLNHAVVGIGYGNEAGTDYWLVKNSWGPSWGENGYFRMHRNESLCGILLDTSYPVL